MENTGDEEHKIKLAQDCVACPDHDLHPVPRPSEQTVLQALVMSSPPGVVPVSPGRCSAPFPWDNPHPSSPVCSSTSLGPVSNLSSAHPLPGTSGIMCPLPASFLCLLQTPRNFHKAISLLILQIPFSICPGKPETTNIPGGQLISESTPPTEHPRDMGGAPALDLEVTLHPEIRSLSCLPWLPLTISSSVKCH